jgi:hypothetical protein
VTRGLIGLAVLGGLTVLGLVILGGVPAAPALDGLALFLGALLMLWLVHATRRASGADRPSRYERALRRPAARPASRPAELERAERVAVLAAANAFDLHLRLRPRLRAIAEHRLASRRGLALSSPEARRLLGEEVWELVRPDRPPPDDRFAPGLPLAEQGAALDRLEKI